MSRKGPTRSRSFFSRGHLTPGGIFGKRNVSSYVIETMSIFTLLRSTGELLGLPGFGRTGVTIMDLQPVSNGVGGAFGGSRCS